MMKPIRAPILFQDYSSAVANLQASLKLLFELDEITPLVRKLLDDTASESMRQIYGQGTRQLVELYQETHGLPATGEVDEQTAQLINDQLKEANLLDIPDKNALSVVRGRIRSRGPFSMPRLRVVAVDKNVGGETLLNDAMTGEEGVYEIQYDRGSRRQGKADLDLQVQARGRDDEILGVSAVRYNAGTEENNTNIFISARKLERPDEYRLLFDDVVGHFATPDVEAAKKLVADLEENRQRADITYLANKTGWDARLVAMMAMAARFGEASGVEPEFFYALFRAGVSPTETALARINPEKAHQAWKDAVQQHIIPANLSERIPENIESLTAFSKQLLLEAPAQIGISTIKDLIGNVLRMDGQQKRFVDLYFEHRDNPEAFWNSAREEFGDKVDELKIDSQLALLTVNNAPLIEKLRTRNDRLRGPVDLIGQGLYRPEAWIEMLKDVPIPREIPGVNADQRKANYAKLLANHVRLSHPTAVAAELVRANALLQKTKPDVKKEVVQFLDENLDTFDLGTLPIREFMRLNNVNLNESAQAEVEKLQRLHQISPFDEAMSILEGAQIESAADVINYDEQTFIETFQEKLGGEPLAQLVYAKSQQVHHAVLNLTTAYLLDRTAVPLYAIEVDQPLEAVRTREDPNVLAYATLEKIFGEMDFCDCEHCRSWLSPAAYLVDLLQFIDTPSPEENNPLDVLRRKRPDIENLQLSCENTNTLMPYIDLVNEILEHHVVHLSLEGFNGHNVDEGVVSEELLAKPKFVDDTAYEVLRKALFPPPLPFHQPLEALRKHFEHFGLSLDVAMERLRVNDQVQRASRPSSPGYGWEDVLMERLGFSRTEYSILTNSDASLRDLFGEDSSATEDQIIKRYSNAKTFARRQNLTYEELDDLLRTQFINPGIRLIPRLQQLGVPLEVLQQFLNGSMSAETFESLLPNDTDMSFGGDVLGWLRDHRQQISELILLSDIGKDDCSFDDVELQRVGANDGNQQLNTFEFLKLLRFIRLQRKLGWSIRQTDKAISALYPAEQLPHRDEASALKKLNIGFKQLIQRLAFLKTVMDLLGATSGLDLEMLLACWSDIDTFGIDSLYQKLFLSPAITELPFVFHPDDEGKVLADQEIFLNSQQPPTIAAEIDTLRAAFNLTQPELELILQRLKFDGAVFDDQTVLNLKTASLIFRHGYLARKLNISVRELLELKELCGLDPFLPLDLETSLETTLPGAVRPPGVRFIEIVQQIQNSPFTVSQLLYYLQHEDVSGNASPSREDMNLLVKTLRAELDRLDQENSIPGTADAVRKPEDLEELKIERICQTLSAKLTVDEALVRLLLNKTKLLHAVGESDQAAIFDFLNAMPDGQDDNPFFSAYLRFLKAVAIAEALGLSTAELEFFGEHDDYKINNEGWLNALPTEVTTKTSIRLFEVLIGHIQYRTVKETLKIQDDQLVNFLKDIPTFGDNLLHRIAQVTGWPETDIADLLAHFDRKAPDLVHLHHFVRLKEAMETVRALGIGASVLGDQLSNDPTMETVRTLQAALRARYEHSAWLAVLQSINDELRILQRDALLAQILHTMGKKKATEHIDTPEKLFEHFLIDVEMEPIMQTSRISQAISSVQLFIQRCLLNLEKPEVASSSIKARQWEWIKHYRVWEANRKVFLFPENWLEPELRDDKTPFFKELESELLQSDINDDEAANALVHYLEKLDEVARLEICGMYFDRNDLGNEADDVVYVIARTAGARRTYYYRRQDGGASWSPWEKVNLPIEDNPVQPVVWKGRLFLFWLGVVQETPTVGTTSTDLENVRLTEMSAKQFRGNTDSPTKRIAVNLYWSEYYHGKWQPPHLSNVNAPLGIGTFYLSGNNIFDRAQLQLWVSEVNKFSADFEGIDGLRISVFYPGSLYRSFKIYNTHSLPDARYDTPPDVWTTDRVFGQDGSIFAINYIGDLKQRILFKAGSFTVVEPGHFVVENTDAPFFYQDRQHVFFIKPRLGSVLLKEPDPIPQPDPVEPGRIVPIEPIDPPEIVVPVEPIDPDSPDPVGPLEPVEPVEPTGPFEPVPSVVRPPDKILKASPGSFKGKRNNINKVVTSNQIIPYDDTLIGVNGGLE
jgi:peptidoglycan hydrolase-like protein with peptidoglycan-binding domain